MNIKNHLILETSSVKQALEKLNFLGADAIIFLVTEKHNLLGSITDGDIRRGFLKNLNFESKLIEFVQSNPKVLNNFKIDLIELKKIIEYRNKNILIIPVIDKKNKVIEILNLRKQKSLIRIDALIMAGGKGSRLMPLTKDTPKPMLYVGSKPIIEYNIDHLKNFGIKNINISIKYLGHKIISYFNNGENKELNINYVKEEKPLGTIGAIKLIKEISSKYILVMNSDILSNFNIEKMFLKLLESNSDMIIATIPYDVTIPYGIIESKKNLVTSINEKPTYTYYSNAGIYIIKKELIKYIPDNEKFDATDLISILIEKKYKILSYPLVEYWLDIGKHNDYSKAQIDIKNIQF